MSDLEEQKAKEFYSEQAQRAVPRQQEVPLDTKAPKRLDVLVERGQRYGSFTTHALLTQKLKTTFHTHMKEHNPTARLTLAETEALDMIFHKLGRIGNGDPHYKDSWTDIVGYATLVLEELEF